MDAHETDAFRNAATVTVAITLTVAGGARVDTADRRAVRVAQRLADAATRARGVVEVQAGLRDARGQEAPLRFPTANTGLGSALAPLGARWVDPDRERALASLAAEHDVRRRRRGTDLLRRQAVGCRQTALSFDPPCHCVYCRPDDHLEVRQLHRDDPTTWPDLICLCGRPGPTDRCDRHTRINLTVLDGDPPALGELAELITPATRKDRP